MDKFPTVDELIKMAKENPEMLDELQKKESQKIIDNSTPENKIKLEGIQFKVNMMKRKNKDKHMKSHLEMADMMWESFHEMNEKLQEYVKQDNQKEVKKPNLKIVKKED